MLDPKLVAKRPLDIFAYFLLAEKTEFNSQYENLKVLEKLGIKVNPNFKLCKKLT